MSEKEFKPFSGWHEFAEATGKRGYEDYAKPNDEVDRETYDHFLNILPPATMGRGYFQVGEAYDSVEIDGKWRQTYMTFLKEGDKYYFLGDLPAGYIREPNGKVHRFSGHLI